MADIWRYIYIQLGQLVESAGDSIIIIIIIVSCVLPRRKGRREGEGAGEAGRPKELLFVRSETNCLIRPSMLDRTISNRVTRPRSTGLTIYHRRMSIIVDPLHLGISDQTDDYAKRGTRNPKGTGILTASFQ